MDSYGYNVGVGIKFRMPDFVLVKVDSSSEPAKDIPLLVLEVKRSLATELEREHGISQLRDYMIELSLRKPDVCVND